VTFVPACGKILNICFLAGMTLLFLLSPLFLMAIRKGRFSCSLDKNEQHHRLLLNSSQDAIALLDYKSGRILEANKAFVNRTDLEYGQLSDKSLNDLLPQQLILRYRRKMNKSIVTNRTLDFLHSNNGNVYRNTLKPVFHNNEFVGKVILQSRDVTHEKRVEEDLRQTSKSYQQLSENLPLGILVQQNNRIEYVNPMASNILCAEQPCDLTGKNLYDLIPPEYQTLVYQMIHNTCFKNCRECFEFKIIRQDGSHIYVEGSGQNITFRGYPAAQVVFWEISHKKQTEDALKRSEIRFRSFFQRNSAPMLLINPGDGSIEDSNLAACRFYGYSASVMRTMSIFQINVSNQQQVKNQMDQTLREESNHFIFRHRLASGQIKDVEIYSSPIMTGEETVLFSIIHDITRRKQAENLIKKLNENLEYKVILRTQKLRQVNKTLLTEIGERQKAENKLKRSYEFLAVVINALSEHIAILNQEGVIIQTNHAWQKFWRENNGTEEYSFNGVNYLKTSEQASGKYSQEGPIVVKEIRKLLQGKKQTFSMEYPCHTLKSLRWFKMTANRLSNGDEIYVVVAHTDITEIKSVEYKISLEKEIWRRSFHAISEGIVLVDENLSIQKGNEAFAKMVGKKETHLAGKKIYHLVHGMKSPPGSCSIYRALQERKEFQREFWEPHLGKYLNVSLDMLSNPQEEFEFAVLTFRDVTYYKQAEKELKARENKFRKIIKHSPIGIYLTDEQGFIKEWNPAMEVLFQVKAREALGKKIWDMQDRLKKTDEHIEDYPLRNREEIERYLDQGVQDLVAQEPREEKVFRADGTPRIIHSKVFSIPGDGRYMLGGLLQDVTAQKKAMERIVDSEKKLKAIFTHSKQMFFILDRYEIIEAFNQNVCSGISNLFKNEVKTGCIFTDVIHPDYKQDFAENFYQALRGEQITREKKLISQTQHEAWIEYTIYPILEQETIRGIFLNIVDISSRKQAEENIYRSLEKEQELNQMKSRFISMVSHEFRNPLTNIFTSVQVLQRYDQKMDRSKKDTQFIRIMESVRMLQSMLDEVSLFSKQHDNRIKLQWVPIEVKPFFQSIADEIISTFVRPIDVNISTGNKTEVVIDKSLLHHIMGNLLSNAVKYSKCKVVLTVSCRDDQKMIINVKDWGRGIPGKDLQNIFNPFFRSSNVGKVSGTGLGLAIVRQCVELLGGEIDIESQLNLGTTVKVRIPYQIPNY
jgi:PAS domain S-box-containing protein